jgi:DNA invertase Pin-like site-specific DNA recombinase
MSMGIGVYLRCSTEEQNVLHQRLAVEGWLARTGRPALGSPSVREYADEGISGAASSAQRPAFSRLLADVAARRVSTVILFEPSRASRDFLSYIEFLALCRRSGVTVDVVGRGELKLETATDMLLQSIDAFASQHERERLSERTRSGLAAAKARGVRLGAPVGNSYRRGKRKSYAHDLVSLVLQLRDAGMTLAAVTEVVGKAHGPTSIATVARIERRARRDKEPLSC